MIEPSALFQVGDRVTVIPGTKMATLNPNGAYLVVETGSNGVVIAPIDPIEERRAQAIEDGYDPTTAKRCPPDTCGDSDNYKEGCGA